MDGHGTTERHSSLLARIAHRETLQIYLLSFEVMRRPFSCCTAGSGLGSQRQQLPKPLAARTPVRSGPPSRLRWFSVFTWAVFLRWGGAPSPERSGGSRTTPRPPAPVPTTPVPAKPLTGGR